MLGSGVRAATRSLLAAYLSRALPPVLRVEPGTVVTVETLTLHGGDYIEPFVTGDAGAESVFARTRGAQGGGPPRRRPDERHRVRPRRRRGLRRPFLHWADLCPWRRAWRGARGQDPRHRAAALRQSAPFRQAFASNVSGWWVYQYDDLLGQQDRRDPDKREVVTIYESDLASPGVARALYHLPMDPADRPVRGAARNHRLSRRPGRSRRAAAACQRPLDFP
jgi:hypothetical protein